MRRSYVQHDIPSFRMQAWHTNRKRQNCSLEWIYGNAPTSVVMMEWHKGIVSNQLTITKDWVVLCRHARISDVLVLKDKNDLNQRFNDTIYTKSNISLIRCMLWAMTLFALTCRLRLPLIVCLHSPLVCHIVHHEDVAQSSSIAKIRVWAQSPRLVNGSILGCQAQHMPIQGRCMLNAIYSWPDGCKTSLSCIIHIGFFQ